MKFLTFPTKPEMAQAAAKSGAAAIRDTLARDGRASIIVATGASQFEMLNELVREPDIRWDKVTCFHLDEYVGLPITHGASFRKYLWERFASRLPLPLAGFHYVNADEGDPQAECTRLGEIIRRHQIAVAFCGIGENGHLAFNDPPADFETDAPYLVVELDTACRQQQLGEGWFPTLESVPQHAISMSIRQILKSGTIICTVPDDRKATAVKTTIEGPITNRAPASILQRHEGCTIFLDAQAASLLTTKKA